MRLAKRTDGNQRTIIKTLRDCACVVEVTSDVGRGFPDCVVKTPRGRVYMVEIKDPTQPANKQRLTELELETQRRWRDVYVVIKTVDQAIELART